MAPSKPTRRRSSSVNPAPYQRARGAVGRGLHGERVAPPAPPGRGSRAQLPGEHGAGPHAARPRTRGPRPARAASRVSRRVAVTPRRAARGRRPRTPGPHRPPPHSRQGLDVRLVGGRVPPDHALVFAQLHSPPWRSRAAWKALLGEFDNPSRPRVEVPDRLEDGEWDDAVDHGARNLAAHALLRNPGGRGGYVTYDPAHPPTPLLPRRARRPRPTAGELRARSPGAPRQPVPRGPAVDRQSRGSRRPRPGDDAQSLPRLAPVRAGTNAKGWLLTILRHASLMNTGGAPGTRRRRHRRDRTVLRVRGAPGRHPQGTFFDRIVETCLHVAHTRSRGIVPRSRSDGPGGPRRPRCGRRRSLGVVVLELLEHGERFDRVDVAVSGCRVRRRYSLMKACRRIVSSHPFAFVPRSNWCQAR